MQQALYSEIQDHRPGRRSFSFPGRDYCLPAALRPFGHRRAGFFFDLILLKTGTPPGPLRALGVFLSCMAGGSAVRPVDDHLREGDLHLVVVKEDLDVTGQHPLRVEDLLFRRIYGEFQVHAAVCQLLDAQKAGR